MMLAGLQISGEICHISLIIIQPGKTLSKPRFTRFTNSFTLASLSEAFLFWTLTLPRCTLYNYVRCEVQHIAVAANISISPVGLASSWLLILRTLLSTLRKVWSSWHFFLSRSPVTGGAGDVSRRWLIIADGRLPFILYWRELVRM